MKIEALKEFLRSLPESYPTLISISDCVAWTFSERDEISWVSWDSNKREYLEGYTCYLPEGYCQDEVHLIANLVTQTGTLQTEIFPLELKVGVDSFWEKYEEYF